MNKIMVIVLTQLIVGCVAMPVEKKETPNPLFAERQECLVELARIAKEFNEAEEENRLLLMLQKNDATYKQYIKCDEITKKIGELQ